MTSNAVAEPIDFTDTLSIYLQYRDFLSVRQLSEALAGVEGIHEAFVREQAGQYYDPARADQSRLRLARVDTGSSITIDIVQGVQQVIHSVDSPAGVVIGTSVALALTARTLVGALAGIARDIIDLRSRRIALRQQISEARWQELTRSVLAAELAQPTTPGAELVLRTPAELVARPLALTVEALVAPNIVELRINGRNVELSAPGSEE